MENSSQRRIKQLIVYLGEESASLFERDIHKLHSNLSELLVQNVVAQNNFITDTLAKCVDLLSPKTQLYATVFALLWASPKHQSYAEQIVDKVQENMQVAFDTGDTIVAKNSLVFLGELMNIGIFNSFTFVTLLHSIINEAEKSLSQSHDYYLQIVIQALPHFYESLLEKSDFEFQSLVDTLKQLMARRAPLLQNFRLSSESSPDWLSLYLQSLFNDIQTQNNMFQQKNKVYSAFSQQMQNIRQIKYKLKLSFNNKVVRQCSAVSQQHLYFLKNINDIDCLSELEKIAIVRQLQEIIQLFKDDKKVLLQKLTSFQIPVENEKQQQEVQVKLTLQALFNEVVVCSKLRQNNLLVYASVLSALIEGDRSESSICEQYQNNINKVFDNVFASLETFTLCFDEKINKILALYLSNNIDSFYYAGMCENYQNHSLRQQVFLQKLFTRLFRLISYERLQDQEIIPRFLVEKYFRQEAGGKKYVSKYFDQPGSMCQADAEIIMDQMNQKVNDEQMQAFLCNQQQVGNNIEASGEDLNSLFLDCFLVKTSNSLTHLKTLTERYKATLKKIVLAKDSYQLNFLNDLQSFWNNQFIPIRNYVQYFLLWGLLKRNILFSWLFKQFEKETQLQNLLASNYIEIFDNVLIQFFQQNSNEEEHLQLLKFIVRKFSLLLMNLDGEEQKQAVIQQHFWQFLMNYEEQIAPHGQKVIQELEELNHNAHPLLGTLLNDLKQVYH